MCLLRADNTVLQPNNTVGQVVTHSDFGVIILGQVVIPSDFVVNILSRVVNCPSCRIDTANGSDEDPD